MEIVKETAVSARHKFFEPVSGPPVPLPEDPKTSLLHWAHLYDLMEIQGAASPHTKEAKRRDLRSFIEYFEDQNGHLNASQWLRRDTQAFLAHLTTSGYKPTSINRTLATLKHFTKWAARFGAFPLGNPTDKVKDFQAERPKPQALTEKEEWRLLKAADLLCYARKRKDQDPIRDRAILILLLRTGLRVSELCSLTLDQVDGKYLREVKCKGRAVRDVFLAKEAREVLDEFFQKSRGKEPGVLFKTRGGNRMGRDDVRRALKRIADQANSGLPAEKHIHLYPHRTRHTVAQRIYNKYGETFAKRVLGHTSDHYIKVYLEQRPEEVEEKIEEVFGK